MRSHADMDDGAAAQLPCLGRVLRVLVAQGFGHYVDRLKLRSPVTEGARPAAGVGVAGDAPARGARRARSHVRKFGQVLSPPGNSNKEYRQ